MTYLALMLLLLPQVPASPAQEAPTPTTAPTYDEGPLRLELLAMREIRFSATDPEMAARLRSELGMQFRLQGERITQVVRQGNLIFTELVDDTGLALLDLDTYTEAERTTTRAVPVPPERLRSEGLVLTTRNKPSARGARTLAKVRGALRLILADKTESITIENPLQFYGQPIVDPRLTALGMEVAILPNEELENAPPGNRCLLLHFKTKADHLQRATFHDGAMKPIPVRDTPVTTRSGVQCQMYYFDAAAFNDEMQLVLEVHPQIEDVLVPVELENVNLP